MSGRARSLTLTFFFARKSPNACSRSWTDRSTSELGSSSMRAILNCRSVFCFGAAGERADHGDVAGGHPARERVPVRWADAVGRLVSVDAAVVGGISDRGAD